MIEQIVICLRAHPGNGRIFAMMKSIKNLDMKTSSFFDHRDPKMVKWLGEKLNN